MESIMMTAPEKPADTTEAAILVVDDDAEIREELCAYLETSGFRVVCAGNGNDAITQLVQHSFDLILLDYWLGGENGFDVLRHVRKSSAIPCIMVTAHDEITDKIVGLELGADDYVVKPVNLRELLARIRALIRRSHAAGVVPARQPEPAAEAPQGTEAAPRSPRAFGRRSYD